MSNNIYVVEFRTGEYDDTTISPMFAFYLEEDANNHVGRINAELKEQNLFWDATYAGKAIKSGTFLYEDEKYSVDYTGAEASYYPLVLRGL